MKKDSLMIQKSAIAVMVCVTSLVALSVSAMDNFHPYRPPFFNLWIGEPRLVEPKMSSLDIIYGHGSTCKSRACDCNDKTSLLNLYGPFNMLKLGSFVPGKSTTNQEDIALIELERTVGRGSFGMLKYHGRFTLDELHVLWTQNFAHGLYLQVDFPIRHMKLSRVCYEDLSPKDGPCPNVHTRTWQTFLKLYERILARYDLRACGFNHTALGDISASVGWGYNYQDTRILDYVDMSFMVGTLFPSGRKRNIDSAFDMPTGYNGHLGFGASAQLSIGMYNWLTFGGYAGAIALLDKTSMVRLQTDIRQNGLIKLAKGCANVQPGVIYDAGAFGKLDHFVGGFSLLGGYSYSAQNKDCVTPVNGSMFNPDAVNCDETLLGWGMHALHFMADYDFGVNQNMFSPRIALFANINIGGHRVFATNVGGFSCGLDISFQC